MSPHRARVGLLCGFAVLLVAPACERGMTRRPPIGNEWTGEAVMSIR